MGFLKKLGLTILKGAQIAVGFAPYVRAAVPQASGVLDKFDQAAGIIFTAEAMIEATGAVKGGALKSAAAGPFIGQLILQLDAVKNLKIKDEKEQDFKNACARISGDLADALNCFE